MSFLSTVPSSCVGSVQCSVFARALGTAICLPLILCAVGTLLLRNRIRVDCRTTRTAGVVAGFALTLWLTAFLVGFVPEVLSRVPGQTGELLRSYARLGLVFSNALLFFSLLAAAVALVSEYASTLALRIGAFAPVVGETLPAAAVAVVCAFLLFANPAWWDEMRDAYTHNVRNAPVSAVGGLLPEDVRLAKKTATLVHAGEKVLLPGVVLRANEWEQWYFTVGGSRAIPLYTDVPFAFFHEPGTDGARPTGYRQHVCERLDLPWLAERRIVWIYESAQVATIECIHGWPEARDKYFELILRDGNASLWRLRTNLLRQAADDPLLRP